MAPRPRATSARPKVRASARARNDLPTVRIVRVALTEDPHAHIVCRSCGRIQRVELTELDRHLLTELAERHPDDWNVERIAFSLTGACRRCREGPAP
ncbi:MAG TPA: hypothetical protein VMG99_07685 [Thermoplasmata archaeon]|jgi:Fe2+ or Zn2+ uptake regulation protein|nr:hypothetical protein [Thermoplasmata archaeon]